MESIRTIAVLEQPTFLLSLQEPESRHICISVHTIRRATVDTPEIDLGFSNFLIKVYLPLHTEGLVDCLVYPGIDFGIKECSSTLLVP